MYGVLLGLPVLLVAFVAAARSAEVIERGRLLAFFDTYEVARVRMLGVELYVDTSTGLSDVVVVCALALIALVLLVGARAARHDPALRRTLLHAGLGAAFLGADDLLAVHETVGHNLGVLAGLPGIDHPDDLIVGLYGLAACAFAWRHRDLLAGGARRPWLVAVVCGGGAVLHDLLPLNQRLLEESLEVVAAGALVVAAWSIVHEQVPLRAPRQETARQKRRAASRAAA